MIHNPGDEEFVLPVFLLVATKLKLKSEFVKVTSIFKALTVSDDFA